MTKIELLKHKLIAKNQFNSDKEQELTKKEQQLKVWEEALIERENTLKTNEKNLKIMYESYRDDINYIEQIMEDIKVKTEKINIVESLFGDLNEIDINELKGLLELI